MSEFNELIKSFSKVKDYVKDFFIFGFRSRSDFDKKSKRSYDNERRRIESYLYDYIKTDYQNREKNISLAIDSNLVDENPLYNVWKTKSFTDNDILLHFFILDILRDNISMTADEIADEILNRYDEVIDINTIRRKCNEYSNEGILKKVKKKNKRFYEIYNCGIEKLFEENDILIDMVKCFQMIAPFGIIGNTILDNFNDKNDIFRLKHGFFVHTLEDEILFSIMNAIKEKRTISITTSKTKFKNFMFVPLEIFVSTRTGRRYICVYNILKKRFTCQRIDYIKEIKTGNIYNDFDKILDILNNNKSKLWGVSFCSYQGNFSEKIKLTLRVNENSEMYIIDRLKKEGKDGNITKVEDNIYTYEKVVFDVNEMLPWIRSFTGRIIDIQTDNQYVKNIFYSDMKKMYKMYETGDIK